MLSVLYCILILQLLILSIDLIQRHFGHGACLLILNDYFRGENRGFVGILIKLRNSYDMSMP